jgi:hypothetical protein
MKCVTATAILLLAVFWLSNGAHAQVVVVGPDGKTGPPPSTPEFCSQVEPIRPNLKLRDDTNVRGHVSDETMAPFKHSPVELRRFISETKQVAVKKVSTDGDGNFDLGVVKRGDYRLLLSSSRAFKQAEKLECWSKNCTLDAALVANPSDQLTAQCPIR